MFEILTVILIVLGFAFIVAVDAELEARSTDQGLIAYKPMAARPRGTQEMDLPPFRFRDPVRPTHAATSGLVVAPHTVGAKAA